MKRVLDRIAGILIILGLACAALIVVLTLLGPALGNLFVQEDDGTCARAVEGLGATTVPSSLGSFTLPADFAVITEQNAAQVQEAARFEQVEPSFSQRLKFIGGSLQIITDETWRQAESAVSPDGSMLVHLTAHPSESTIIRVCDAATGQQIRAWSSDETTRAIAFTPDGQLLIVNEGRGIFTLYDTSTFRRVDRWDLREGRQWNITRYLTLSPDGSLAAFAMDRDEGFEMRLWSVSAGQEITVLPGHTDIVIDVVFSPDGTLIASYSMDGTVRLWGVPQS